MHVVCLKLLLATITFLVVNKSGIIIFLWCPLPTMFVHNTKETISWTYITGHSLIVLHHLLIASVDSEHFANAFGCCVSLITEKKLEEHLKYLNIRVNLSLLQPLQLSIHDPNYTVPVHWLIDLNETKFLLIKKERFKHFLVKKTMKVYHESGQFSLQNSIARKNCKHFVVQEEFIATNE